MSSRLTSVDLRPRRTQARRARSHTPAGPATALLLAGDRLQFSRVLQNPGGIEVSGEGDVAKRAILSSMPILTWFIDLLLRLLQSASFKRATIFTRIKAENVISIHLRSQIVLPQLFYFPLVNVSRSTFTVQLIQQHVMRQTWKLETLFVNCNQFNTYNSKREQLKLS